MSQGINSNSSGRVTTASGLKEGDPAAAGCCCGGGTCLCAACGGSTPRFLKVTLAGITLCGGCLNVGGENGYQITGTVNATFCLPQSGASDGDGWTACAWTDVFYPGVTLTVYNGRSDCSVGGVVTTKVGLRVSVFYKVVGGVPGWQVYAMPDPGDDGIAVPFLFDGFVAAADCTTSATATSSLTDCTDPGFSVATGGTALVEPGACEPADCVETEPACPECNGNTPSHYTLDLVDVDGSTAFCIPYSGSLWVNIDPSAFEGSYCLTRDGTPGNECVWRGVTGAIDFAYYPDINSGCGGTPPTVVNQVCDITLTKQPGPGCTWHLTVVSRDGLVTVFDATVSVGGACGHGTAFNTAFAPSHIPPLSASWFRCC